MSATLTETSGGTWGFASSLKALFTPATTEHRIAASELVDTGLMGDNALLGHPDMACIKRESIKGRRFDV